jgi:hypothetical protein
LISQCLVRTQRPQYLGHVGAVVVEKSCGGSNCW